MNKSNKTLCLGFGEAQCDVLGTRDLLAVPAYCLKFSLLLEGVLPHFFVVLFSVLHGLGKAIWLITKSSSQINSPNPRGWPDGGRVQPVGADPTPLSSVESDEGQVRLPGS